MTAPSDIRVDVVGGGIGGLSAALFLQRAGIRNVAVYEQSSELREIGAGIQMAPNAVRLLRRLGLAEALAEVSVRLEGGWEFRRWDDGRVLFSQPFGELSEQLFGEPYYVVHRRDLLDLLREAVPESWINLGHRCTAIAEEGDEVVAIFGNGTSVRAGALIGADGIHSVIHDSILPPEPATFSGLSAYRALVPVESAPELTRRPVTTLWLGPHRHFVHYPVSAGREINIVSCNPAGGFAEESWTADGRVEDLAAEYAGWHECVQQLISAVTHTKQYAFYDRAPLKHWTRGRVTLMGDAAHPMMPFFAQGASQAIEDAAVLGGCLHEASHETVPEALRRYEALRRERASSVQLVSRERREHHHLPDGEAQRRRDEAMANEDPLRYSAWIYGHDVEEDLTRESAAPR